MSQKEAIEQVIISLSSEDGAQTERAAILKRLLSAAMPDLQRCTGARQIDVQA
jgi:hypothetical protein